MNFYRYGFVCEDFLDSLDSKQCTSLIQISRYFSPQFYHRLHGSNRVEIRRRTTIMKSVCHAENIQVTESVWRAHITLSTKLRLYNTNRPICIWMLGSNQGRSGMSWCRRSVMPLTHTWRDPITVRPALTKRPSVKPHVKEDWQCSAMHFVLRASGGKNCIAHKNSVRVTLWLET